MAAAMLKNWKFAISQQRFDRSPWRLSWPALLALQIAEIAYGW